MAETCVDSSYGGNSACLRSAIPLSAYADGGEHPQRCLYLKARVYTRRQSGTLKLVGLNELLVAVYNSEAGRFIQPDCGDICLAGGDAHALHAVSFQAAKGLA